MDMHVSRCVSVSASAKFTTRVNWVCLRANYCDFMNLTTTRLSLLDVLSELTFVVAASVAMVSRNDDLVRVPVVTWWPSARYL